MHPAFLALAAFWLASCPFSVWVGRCFLGKDIRDYGDGNPGAANVFRAGGRLTGILAIILDVGKGVPFVLMALSIFGLSDLAVIIVAVSAMLGHAFSPLLRFRGGKSIAVTFGALLALPQHEMLVIFTLFMLLGFLFLDSHVWTAMFGPAGSLGYLIITGASRPETLFMLGVLAIFFTKSLNELQTAPKPRIRLINWIQSRR